jgi:DNA-binding PadR family transcriptional regulator
MAKRGETLEFAVLGLLHESPMHGYELRKQLNGVLGWGRLLSYGSLYPALKKMLKSGWITEHISVPPPGAGRRQRIVYELTPDGHDWFEKLMSDAGPANWEDDNFDVRFAFFSRTDMEIRLRILEGRRSRLEERLARVQTQLSRTQKQVDAYALELQRHGIESVEREVSWLSDLIAAERRRGAPGSTAGDPIKVTDSQPLSRSNETNENTTR